MLFKAEHPLNDSTPKYEILFMSIVAKAMQPSNELSPKERKDSGILIVFKETHPLKDAASILFRDFPNVIFVIEEQSAKAKELIEIKLSGNNKLSNFLHNLNAAVSIVCKPLLKSIFFNDSHL
nr:hypothetical protein [Prevotella sp.]